MPIGQAERLPNFVGGSYQGAVSMIDCEYAVNLYPQFGVKGANVKNALLPRPGLSLFAWLPGAPVRAIFWQDGRGFAVSGNFFCEFFQSGAFTVWGTVAADSNNATICSNGDDGLQVFIVSGGHGYIFALDTGTLTDITTQDLFPAPALGGAFLQGYFLAWQQGSNLLAFSAPLDGTDWTLASGGGQARTTLNSDNISNCIAQGGYLVVMGTKNTEFWQNTGAADIAFAPVPSAVPAWGLDAPFTLVGLDNAIYGVGVNEDGARHVIRINGYNVNVVSTPAISRLLSTVQSFTNATAMGYALDGHPMYGLNVPNLATPDHGTTSLYYDNSTDIWHERGIWDSTAMQFFPDLPRVHCYGFGQHLLGDRQSGAIYSYVVGQNHDDVVIADLAAA